jgi:hypothetical protein
MPVTNALALCRNGELAAIWHGIARVYREVQERRVDRPRISNLA